MNKYQNLLIFLIALSILPSLHAQDQELNPSVLEGNWILDLTPQKPDDSNFAAMEITKAKIINKTNTLEFLARIDDEYWFKVSEKRIP